MEIFPNDAIKFMICYSTLELNGSFWIASIESIHKVIYKLKQNYPEFFSNIRFSKHTLTPYSEQIESTRSALMASRCIFMDAPDFKRIFIEKEMKNALLQNLEEKYSSEILDIAKKIVIDFDKIIKKV